jgi:CHASE3 domain sensor protein
VTRELIDDIQPARVSAYQLQGALRDQETSLRGYVIAADRQFLIPTSTGNASNSRRPRTSRRDSVTGSI